MISKVFKYLMYFVLSVLILFFGANMIDERLSLDVQAALDQRTVLSEAQTKVYEVVGTTEACNINVMTSDQVKIIDQMIETEYFGVPDNSYGKFSCLIQLSID